MTSRPLKTWLVSKEVSLSYSAHVEAATEDEAIALGQALFNSVGPGGFAEDNHREDWYAECQEF